MPQFKSTIELGLFVLHIATTLYKINSSRNGITRSLILHLISYKYQISLIHIQLKNYAN
ncbi:hypothetical protein TXIAM_30367 [Tenacibaculum xiamenense]